MLNGKVGAVVAAGAVPLLREGRIAAQLEDGAEPMTTTKTRTACDMAPSEQELTCQVLPPT